MNIKSNIQFEIIAEENWTFTPALDSKSMQILEKKKEKQREQEKINSDVFQRLSKTIIFIKLIL